MGPSREDRRVPPDRDRRWSSSLGRGRRAETVRPPSYPPHHAVDLHETLVEFFRVRPDLAPELLAGPLGQEVPAFERTRTESGEIIDLTPTEYRADAVVTLCMSDEPVLAVVVEAQLHRDLDKRRTWPIYLTTLRGRLRCPAILIVLCPDPSVAAWCAEPIPIGHPGFTLTPLVMGPDRVPVLTSTEQAAAAPELAVLSAIVHGPDPRHRVVLDALPGAFGVIDLDHADLYYDVVLAALPKAASDYLEALMSTSYEYQSDFARRTIAQGRAEGRTEGRAEAVLAFLDARGIVVPEDERTRITACTDLDQLDVWVRRAATVTTSRELFTQP